MSNDHVATKTAEAVESLSKLRARHIELMRTVRHDNRDEAQVQRIHDLIDGVKKGWKVD